MTSKQDDQPKAIDLFAGVGGLSLGATRSGLEVVSAVEIDKTALETHSRNFPATRHLQLDVSRLSGGELFEASSLKRGELDVLIGGPPCQGFSNLGLRDAGDARNFLYVHFFRLVAETCPRFFLAENVRGILNPRYEPIRTEAFSHLKERYELLEPMILKASDLGVPTTRTRVFFIGFDKKRVRRRISENELKSRILQDRREDVRVSRALEGLPKELPKHGICYLLTREKGRGSFEESIRRNIPSGVGEPESIDLYLEKGRIEGCLPTTHSCQVVERFAKLRPGETDKVSRCQRLDPNGYCPTLRAGTGADHGSFQAVRPIHYSEPRVISPREAARLQGFPDWFVFHKTKWHSFRQIGNSVSPIVAERVLRAISDFAFSQ